MRPSLSLLAVLVALSLLGCAHRAGGSGAVANPGRIAAPLLAEHAARSRLLHIYVDADNVAAAPVSADLTHASTVAVSLRDQMRQRGYDVRGTESALPKGEAGATPGALARAVAAGQPPPASSRSITYLHPNAPQLLLFVHLQESPAAATQADSKPSVILGAFIADSADGTILWSNRVTARPPATDSQLRLLAVQLLKTLPTLPPA